MTIAVAVLAGGASRRFGRDKAAEPVDGSASLERVLAAARAVTGEVFAVGGAGAVPDLAPGEGPLQAAVAAFRVAPGRDLVLLPCDVPLVTPAHLAFLTRALPAGVLGRALLADDGRPAPLPGFYTAAAAPAFEAAWAAGRRSLRAALASLPLELVSDADLHAAGLTPAGFADFDTAEDLARLSRG